MNTFAFIGRRLTGTAAGAFAITPPGFAGVLPVGVRQIEATSSVVFAFARTMLRGPDDLTAARAVHEAFTIGTLAGFPGGQLTALLRGDVIRMFPYIDFSRGSPGYFFELDRLVRSYPPLARDVANLARFAPLGLGVCGGIDAERAAGLDEAVAAGYAAPKQSLRLVWVDGWAKRANVPPFIGDPLQRAANNFYALGKLVSDEGVYFGTRQGGMGDWLEGKLRYRLRFAAGQLPPVDAFWSLTLYDKTYSLFDNKLDRYGILDRSAGPQYEPDGSLEIQIQADEPAEGIANWLLAPRDDFQLIIRAYQPRPAILDESYRPPALRIVD